MHLSEFMAQRELTDEQVAEAIGRSRVSVSRYRRRLERPNWDAVEQIKAFSDGLVTADDWLEPAPAEGSQ